MKKILYFLCLVNFSLSAFCQVPNGRAPENGQRQATPNIGHIYGKIVDSTGKGIGNVSALLLQPHFDAATKKTKEVLLKGIATQANGDFNFEDLPVQGTLKLKISATGFANVEQKISFTNAGSPRSQSPDAFADKGRSIGGFDKDLGKIVMRTDVHQMQNVVVATTSGRLKMDIDKKVFNVDKNIVST